MPLTFRRNSWTKYRQYLQPYLRKIKGRVTLGDASTTHNVNEAVLLTLRFVDDEGREHRGEVNLVSFESGSHVIIGLPDISRSFGALFISMVQQAILNPATTPRVKHATVLAVQTSLFFKANDHYLAMITDDSVAEDIYASSDSSLADSFRPEDSNVWCEQYGDNYDSNTEEEDFFEGSSASSCGNNSNHPWTVNILEEPWTFRLNAAPEDDDIPIPC